LCIAGVLQSLLKCCEREFQFASANVGGREHRLSQCSVSSQPTVLANLYRHPDSFEPLVKRELAACGSSFIEQSPDLGI